MDGNRLVGGLWCSEVLAGLSDYLDRDLGPEMEAKVNQHLAQCVNCKRFGADIVNLLATLSGERREITPEMSARLRLVLTR